MGCSASYDIAAAIRSNIQRNNSTRVIFASAPSQLETLTYLAQQPDIDWQLVSAFNMDEYIGLPATAPQRFGNWLNDHFFKRVNIGSVQLIHPEPDAEQAAQNYANLLSQKPIDIVCLGIGVNGHLAFNDPPVADFIDPLDVKLVKLDAVCRQQQVDDQCFDRLTAVPTSAITLTLPRLMRAEKLFCMVPGAAKKAAVTATLTGSQNTTCPASIMQTHPNVTLYLDQESAPDERT